jgi:hypothetical protein
MRRFLAGMLVAVILAGVGVYVGLPHYAQKRAEGAVQAAFERARAEGADARHGPVQFDFASRTLTISDIVYKSKGDQGTTLTIARLVMANVDQPDDKSFTASRIDITDLALATPDLSGFGLAYKAVSVVIENYTGPTTFPPSPTTTDVAGGARQALAYFAALSAQSIAAPSLTVRVTMSGSLPTVSADYAYSDIALRDIRNGRIGTASAARTVLTSPDTPDAGKVNIDVGKMSMAGIDVTPIIAILNPATATDDRYMPMYGQVEFGPMTIKTDKAGEIRVGRMSMDGFAVRPSKFKLADLLTMKDVMPPPGQQASPEQARAILEKIANVYEGIRMGSFEMRDMTMNPRPDIAFKIAAIRVSNLEGGRFGEIALEGLDGRAPTNEPIRVGRAALKGVDFAKLMRTAGQFSPTQQASPEQVIGMLAYLEGIQLADVDVPSKTTPRPVRVAAFDLSWGQFVGPFPTQVKLNSKMSTPVIAGDSDPVFAQLAAVGVTALNVSVDFGVGWSEGTQTISVTPLVLDVGDAATMSIKLAVQNASRGLFTLDPVKALMAATALEAGPLELSVRDTGVIEMAFKEFAKMQGLSPEAARTMVAAKLTADAAPLAQGNPDVQALVGKVIEFINSPRATLTITVTPKARVNLLQSVELARTDPMTVLTQFNLNAAVSK